MTTTESSASKPCIYYFNLTRDTVKRFTYFSSSVLCRNQSSRRAYTAGSLLGDRVNGPVMFQTCDVHSVICVVYIYEQAVRILQLSNQSGGS